jgi:hypothetical protein
MIIKWLQILGCITILTQNVNAASSIKGKIDADSTWSPVVYLSIIPSFDQLYYMSNQMIIESSELDETGRFFRLKQNICRQKITFTEFIFRKKEIRRHHLLLAGKTKTTCF